MSSNTRGQNLSFDDAADNVKLDPPDRRTSLVIMSQTDDAIEVEILKLYWGNNSWIRGIGLSLKNVTV
jgi:hypothetical protein